ncbi:conserved hypothetical protein [Neospora caninum Liverpool]|uniref:Uncharacterized protein n=1 Tax=Neospora caninum (strain Liverpool) TaxID=572307 RepID=F0VAU1_NEOCL|nr:conserved hypothetical protein [Neospora caninum Liverpool]CBZ51349.1 conserved hypothetical protein [Neospora caninum Liverpool]|eukprot:XP_003881382.1 conserved hypothetical protein [Neospora caninum Liverpool]
MAGIVSPRAIAGTQGSALSEQQTVAQDKRVFFQMEQLQQAEGRGALLVRGAVQAAAGDSTGDLAECLRWAGQALCQPPEARESIAFQLGMTGALVKGVPTLHSQQPLPDGSYEILPSRGTEEAREDPEGNVVISSRRSSFLSAYSQLSRRSAVSEVPTVDEAATASSHTRSSLLSDRVTLTVGSGEEGLRTGLTWDGLRGRGSRTTENEVDVSVGGTQNGNFETEAERGEHPGRLKGIADFRQLQDTREPTWGLLTASEALSERQAGGRSPRGPLHRPTVSELQSTLQSVRRQVSDVRRRRPLLQAHVQRLRRNVICLLNDCVRRRVGDGEGPPAFTHVQGKAVLWEVDHCGESHFFEGKGVASVPLQVLLRVAKAVAQETQHAADSSRSCGDEASEEFDPLAKLGRPHSSFAAPSGLRIPHHRHPLVDAPFRVSGAGPSAFSDVSAELRITKEALYQMRALRCQELLGLFAFQRSERAGNSACKACGPEAVTGGASPVARLDKTEKGASPLGTRVSPGDLPRGENEENEEDQKKGTWTQVSSLDGGLWKPEPFFSSRKEALLDLQAALNLLAYIVAALASYLDVLLPFPVYLLPSSSPSEQQKRKSRLRRGSSSNHLQHSSRASLACRSGASRRPSVQLGTGITGLEGVKRSSADFPATSAAPPSSCSPLGSPDGGDPAAAPEMALRAETGDSGRNAQIPGPRPNDDALGRSRTELGERQVHEQDRNKGRTDTGTKQRPPNTWPRQTLPGQSDTQEGSVLLGAPSFSAGPDGSSWLSPSSSAAALSLSVLGRGRTPQQSTAPSPDAGSARPLQRGGTVAHLAAARVGGSERRGSDGGTLPLANGKDKPCERAAAPTRLEADCAGRTDQNGTEARASLAETGTPTGQHTHSSSPVPSSLSPGASGSCTPSDSSCCSPPCPPPSSLQQAATLVPARNARRVAPRSSPTDSWVSREEALAPSRFSSSVPDTSTVQVRDGQSLGALLENRASHPGDGCLLVNAPPSDFHLSAPFPGSLAPGRHPLSLSSSSSHPEEGTDESRGSSGSRWSVVDSLFPPAAELLRGSAARSGFSRRLPQRPHHGGDSPVFSGRSLARLLAERLPAVLHSVGPAAARFSPRLLGCGVCGEPTVPVATRAEERRAIDQRTAGNRVDVSWKEDQLMERDCEGGGATSERDDTPAFGAPRFSAVGRDEGASGAVTPELGKVPDRGGPHRESSPGDCRLEPISSFSPSAPNTSGEGEDSPRSARRLDGRSAGMAAPRTSREDRWGREGSTQVFEVTGNKTLFMSRKVGAVFSRLSTSPAATAGQDASTGQPRGRPALPLFSWSGATMAAAAAAARDRQVAQASRRKAAFRGGSRRLDVGFGEGRVSQSLREEADGEDGNAPRHRGTGTRRGGDVLVWRQILNGDNATREVLGASGVFSPTSTPSSSPSPCSSLLAVEQTKTPATHSCGGLAGSLKRVPSDEASSKDTYKAPGSSADAHGRRERGQQTAEGLGDRNGVARLSACGWRPVQWNAPGSSRSNDSGDSSAAVETATPMATKPAKLDETGEKESQRDRFPASAQASTPSQGLSPFSHHPHTEREAQRVQSLDASASRRPPEEPNETSSAEKLARDTQARMEMETCRRMRGGMEAEMLESPSGGYGRFTLGQEESGVETSGCGRKASLEEASGKDATRVSGKKHTSGAQEFAASWRMEHCEDDGDETEDEGGCAEAANVDFRIARAIIVHRGTGEAFRLSAVDGDVKLERLQTTLQLLNWDLLALHLGKEGVLPPAAIWRDTLALLAALMNSEAFSACGPFLSSFGSADLRPHAGPESARRAPRSSRWLRGAAPSRAPGGGAGWSRLSATMQSFPPLLLLGAAMWGRASPTGPVSRQNARTPELSSEQPTAQRGSIVLLERSGAAGGNRHAGERDDGRVARGDEQHAASGEMLAGLPSVCSLLDEPEEDGWMLIDPGPADLEGGRGASALGTVPSRVSGSSVAAQRGGETVQEASGNDEVSSAEHRESPRTPVPRDSEHGNAPSREGEESASREEQQAFAGETPGGTLELCHGARSPTSTNVSQELLVSQLAVRSTERTETARVVDRHLRLQRVETALPEGFEPAADARGQRKERVRSHAFFLRKDPETVDLVWPPSLCDGGRRGRLQPVVECEFLPALADDDEEREDEEENEEEARKTECFAPHRQFLQVVYAAEGRSRPGSPLACSATPQPAHQTSVDGALPGEHSSPRETSFLRGETPRVRRALQARDFAAGSQAVHGARRGGSAETPAFLSAREDETLFPAAPSSFSKVTCPGVSFSLSPCTKRAEGALEIPTDHGED